MQKTDFSCLFIGFTFFFFFFQASSPLSSALSFPKTEKKAKASLNFQKGMSSYRKLRADWPFLCPPSLHWNTQSLLMAALWTNKLFCNLKRIYCLLVTRGYIQHFREKSPLYGQGLSQSQLHFPLYLLERRDLIPSTILFITSPDENCHIPFPLRLSGIYSLATELRKQNLVQL